MSNFESYVKSSAFNINLSERMCIALIARYNKDDLAGLHRLNMSVLDALERRGLLGWQVIDGEKNGMFVTDAGKLVAKLLLLAGYQSLVDEFKDAA